LSGDKKKAGFERTLALPRQAQAFKVLITSSSSSAMDCTAVWGADCNPSDTDFLSTLNHFGESSAGKLGWRIGVDISKLWFDFRQPVLRLPARQQGQPLRNVFPHQAGWPALHYL
jgi:hypothetical protein